MNCTHDGHIDDLQSFHKYLVSGIDQYKLSIKKNVLKKFDEEFRKKLGNISFIMKNEVKKIQKYESFEDYNCKICNN